MGRTHYTRRRCHWGSAPPATEAEGSQVRSRVVTSGYLDLVSSRKRNLKYILLTFSFVILSYDAI